MGGMGNDITCLVFPLPKQSFFGVGMVSTEKTTRVHHTEQLTDRADR